MVDEAELWIFSFFFFFFKQKTAYEIVSRDWSSDVCSSDNNFADTRILRNKLCQFFWSKFQEGQNYEHATIDVEGTNFIDCQARIHNNIIQLYQLFFFLLKVSQA